MSSDPDVPASMVKASRRRTSSRETTQWAAASGIARAKAGRKHLASRLLDPGNDGTAYQKMSDIEFDHLRDRRYCTDVFRGQAVPAVDLDSELLGTRGRFAYAVSTRQPAAESFVASA